MNISRSGALISVERACPADSLPGPGEAVHLEVPLPVYGRFGQRCIYCDAVAIHTEQEAHAHVVALQFERVEFRNVPQAAMLASSAAVM